MSQTVLMPRMLTDVLAGGETQVGVRGGGWAWGGGWRFKQGYGERSCWEKQRQQKE